MSLPENLPQRVVIAGNCDRPPVLPAIAAAFTRLGLETKLFYTQTCNTLYDRYVIHTINHLAHNLRLLPKSGNYFEGHPQSHKEYRNRKLIELCREFKPDLVFLNRGLSYKWETIQELRQLSTVFLWYTESETRYHEIEKEIPFCHHLYFFSSKGIEWARERGIQHASLLQHAVDTAAFYPLDLPEIYDWCFVGQWNPRRQQYIEGLAEVSPNYVIYGPRWRKRVYLNPSLWLRIKGKGIWGEKLTRLYNQTKVVINVSVWGQEDKGGTGVNLRLLEVPACRRCLLTDYNRDAERLLTPGEDFVSAASLPEMQEKLAALLADAQKRGQIAQNGYAKASQVRNYDHFVAQVCADWAARTGKTS